MDIEPVLNESGQLAHRSQVLSLQEMLRVLRGLPDCFEICYEASCGYGDRSCKWLAISVRISSPVRT